jgi:hypothetical protein
MQITWEHTLPRPHDGVLSSDTDAQMDHKEHGYVHDDTLHE